MSSTIETRIEELLENRNRLFGTTLAHRAEHSLTSKRLEKSLPNPFPSSAKASDLLSFFSRTGVTLPSDIKRWLEISNGPAGFFGVNAQTGCDIEEHWSIFPEWKTIGWIPVGRDGNGNFFIRTLGEKSPKSAVFFIDSANLKQVAYAVSSDVLEFVRFALERDEALNKGEQYGWPFDEGFVLSRDPELRKVTSSALPWSKEQNPDALRPS